MARCPVSVPSPFPLVPSFKLLTLSHSARNAIVGSTRIARIAGIKLATTAATNRTPLALPSTSGSCGRHVWNPRLTSAIHAHVCNLDSCVSMLDSLRDVEISDQRRQC